MSGRLLGLVCTAAMAAGTVLAPLPATAEPAPSGPGQAGSVADAGAGTGIGPGTGATADAGLGAGTGLPGGQGSPDAADGASATSTRSLTGLLTTLQTLYRQAETATEDYDATEERLRAQRAKVTRLDQELARTRLALRDSRAAAGRLARQQYQGASTGVSPYVRLLMAADAQHALDEGHVIGRVAGDRAATVTRLTGTERRNARLARAARQALDEQLSLAQRQNQAKELVRARLGQVEALLASLGPEQMATLTALENTREADRQTAFLASGALGDDGSDASGATPAGTAGTSRAAGPADSTDTTDTIDTADTMDTIDTAEAAGTSGAAGSSRNPTAAGDIAVRTAVEQLGKPYEWGAEGPDSYDCSGLTSEAWARAGRPIPRTSQEQWARLPHVPLNRLRPGDLVIYFPEATHVGLYIGDGKVIHAPRPGAHVKVSPIAANPVLGAVRPDAHGRPLTWYVPPRLPVGAGDGSDAGYASASR